MGMDSTYENFNLIKNAKVAIKSLIYKVPIIKFIEKKT